MEAMKAAALAGSTGAGQDVREELVGMIMGFMGAAVTRAFARFGIADRVKDGRRAEELARELGASPDGMFRYLRAAVGIGLLHVDDAGVFTLTERGALLKSDAVGSLRQFAVAIPSPGHWMTWSRLEDAVMTGKSPVEAVFGKDIWGYFRENPAELEDFAGAMGGLSHMAGQEVTKVYDFSRFVKIVDVAGSHGIMLGHILRSAPGASGVLFDLPEVIAGAGGELAQMGVRERVTLESGDFFKGVPAGGDLYVLKHIIHDWDDEKSVAILSNCAKAARAGAKLALVEFVLPERTVPAAIPYFSDLNMLTMVNGRERTAAEFGGLMARSGWKMTAVVPTDGGLFSVVEGERV